MNDEFDPFDIENLRSPEAVAAEAALRADMEARKRGMPSELGAKLAAHKAKNGRTKQHRNKDDLFVQILHRAVSAGGKALRDRQWMVWLYIHYRALWDKTNTVEIGNKTLREWGVGRAVKNRALYAFERAGLVSIEWRGNKSPLVTLRADLSMWRGRNGSDT